MNENSNIKKLVKNTMLKPPRPPSAIKWWNHDSTTQLSHTASTDEQEEIVIQDEEIVKPVKHHLTTVRRPKKVYERKVFERTQKIEKEFRNNFMSQDQR